MNKPITNREELRKILTAYEEGASVETILEDRFPIQKRCTVCNGANAFNDITIKEHNPESDTEYTAHYKQVCGACLITISETFRANQLKEPICKNLTASPYLRNLTEKY